jgi:hypothetical protein
MATQNSGGQKQECLQKREQRSHSDPNEPQRQGQQPHKRKSDENQQSQRPAQDQENAPGNKKYERFHASITSAKSEIKLGERQQESTLSLKLNASPPRPTQTQRSADYLAVSSMRAILPLNTRRQSALRPTQPETIKPDVPDGRSSVAHRKDTGPRVKVSPIF